MTFEELQAANEQIRTTNIRGKEYAEVNQRIKVFRMLFPEGCIQTEIYSLENGVITMKATIRDDNGRLLSTGFAQEIEGASNINKTSYVENCETSAVGRALGMLGIGIDTSVASYEEVANAIEGQKTIDEVKVKALRGLAEEKGVDEETICKRFKVDSLEKLTEVQHIRAVKALEATD